MFLFSCAYAYVACVMLIAQVWTRLYFLFRFKKIYQTLETVFHRLFKHLEFRQKYPAARRIFESRLTKCSDVAMKRPLSCLIYYMKHERQCQFHRHIETLRSCDVKKRTDQHVTKTPSLRHESNPWPPEHWVGALSTELLELMESNVI